MVSYLSILLLLVSAISCLDQSVIQNLKEVSKQNQQANSKNNLDQKGIFSGSSENVQTEEQDAGDAVVAYNSSASIKKTLVEHKGDFDQDLFSELLTRKDLSHLLLSDIENMMDKMASEWPELIKISKIGQTWQGRDIRVLELDARNYIEKLGVQPQSLVQAPKQKKKKDDDDEDDCLTPANLNPDKSENKTDDKKKEDVSKLSEQELIERNEDIHRDQQKKADKKQEEFNAVSEDKKVEALNDQLGINLIQLDSQMGKAKKSAHGILQQKLLLQLMKDEDPFNILTPQMEEPTQSIADLTNLAKKEIKENSEQSQKAAPATENKQTQETTAETTKPEQKQEEAKPEATDLNQTLESNKTQAEEEKAQVQTEESANKTEATPTVSAEASIQELTQAAKKDNAEVAKQAEKGKEEKKPAHNSFYGDQALLITGATHARELLSMQVPLFMALKLMHQGLYQNKDRYQQMLLQTKFYILPVLNVDGAALVEENWIAKNKIINKRKNMNPNYAQCGDENSGVDLNRNFGIDWKAQNFKNKTELCGDFWPGSEAFSEPETRALRDFIGSKKNELKFVINCHTSGNEFIWPFNGREPNDIESRAPGYLAIFQDIAENAPFPDGVMKGNSYEVIGDPMGGDQDDYILSTFGIPSVTSEMGFFGQYIQDWRCQSKAVCFEILRENSRWIEYIFGNLPAIADKLLIK